LEGSAWTALAHTAAVSEEVAQISLWRWYTCMGELLFSLIVFDSLSLSLSLSLSPRYLLDIHLNLTVHCRSMAALLFLKELELEVFEDQKVNSYLHIPRICNTLMTTALL